MPRIILFNKPFNVLSQFTDTHNRVTLKHYLKNCPGFYVAGRLDYDSEGLLILTDNGALQHRITEPNQKMYKTYQVQLEGDIDDQAINNLRQGITLKDGKTRPAKVERIPPPALWPRHPPIRQRKNQPTSWITLRILEGRNRQVRRMTAHVGFPTLRLIRTCIGPWSLQGLEPGQFCYKTVHTPDKENKRLRTGKQK